eukprot:CAMPEP_0202361900 /NCGR_PEP_ID=MMETSP1126-20121109/14281_1 /ASSEMBLY_ACC=CAM_ASM_000457 /TAXON_ID=3047 /ORGANISM="Dunaliella tertiolecta, Strain CCMP1320" /LENGTH=42 /DNA_ID= /DNA_START= /DNA_END= /DNA_ORIENTATION=
MEDREAGGQGTGDLLPCCGEGQLHCGQAMGLTRRLVGGQGRA